MICPKCGSSNVNVTAVTETKNKTRWGCGCLVTWLAFLFPKRVSETHTEAICQSCGKRWAVSRSAVNRNAHEQKTNATKGTSLAESTGSFIDKLHSAELPFYKRTWFLVFCGLFFPLISIALVWLIHKEWDVKKKGVVSGVLAVWFIIMLCSGGGEAAEPVSGSDVPATSVSSGDASETNLSFTINGGETGQYGEWITLGEGTETPDTFIAYRIPSGEYKATNLDPDYPLYIYVYSEATEIVDGVEYQTECLQTISIQPGESGAFTVPDGYYIQLAGSDNGTSAAIESQ